MSSLLFPSHRLFVAALHDVDGRRSKRPRSARLINLSESAPLTSPGVEGSIVPPPLPSSHSPLRTEWRPGW